jgi:hypothetical protein
VSWLGRALDAAKRSQNLFMDRDDMLNLSVVTNLPLSNSARPGSILFSDELRAGRNDAESA